ncbi:MAG: mandelate racemase/muconate lactonizing enzyme family protein [Gammaproteobacteria bacterium]|nr:mandelate racemase/muconate lactonizing enzyme family protein [Gammaproteobacteria bacterium]
MKIAKIEVFQAHLPYSGGIYRLSGEREYTGFDASFVRITTECGIEGWGESTPFGSTYIAAHGAGARAGIAEIAPSLLGKDPRQLDRINETMDGSLKGHNHAKTPIDVACWDIFGKSVEMPVCDLLGGRVNKPLALISSIYAGDADDMRARVQLHREAGYLGHSIKITDDPLLNAQRIEACLEGRQKGEYFIVDANGGLSVESALRLINILPSSFDIVLEAPCATWRECMSLRRRTSMPIIWDELAQSEEDIINLIAEDGADGIGLKISKNGGLTRCRRQRDICIAAGYTMSVQDTTGSDIAFAAIVHMGQTVPEKYLRCILECRDMVSLKTADGDYVVENGFITAPQDPGLGISPRMDVLGEAVLSYS